METAGPFNNLDELDLAGEARGGSVSSSESFCDDLAGGVNNYLHQKCDSKFNHMQQIGDDDVR
jgi:hypothetical protein